MAAWPEWWRWEIETSPHLLKRMVDRGFSETDLRTMLTNAVTLVADKEPGRWLVHTVHDSSPWQIIVEPDLADQLLVIITAYAVKR